MPLPLNAHMHFHCCIADGMFSACDGELRFYPATDLTNADVAAAQELIRARVLRYLARHELLSDEAAAGMRRWGHGGGFSLHAAVRIEANDRTGLERLSALIPPPRRHRHRYHRAFAPNAALRPLVSVAAPQPLRDTDTTQVPPKPPAHALPVAPRITTPARRRAAYLWAQLLARIYACFPLTCTRCGAETRVIGFITAAHAVRRILTHIAASCTP